MSGKVIGQNIERHRRARGMSRAELAKSCGLTPVAIYYLETGQRHGLVDTVETVARALGVKPASLLRGSK